MTIAFDSFNATTLDAFIQSKLDARGVSGQTHTRIITEQLRQNTVITRTYSYPLDAATGTTRRGYVRNQFTSWPPYIGTLSISNTAVSCMLRRGSSTNYDTRRGEIQWNVPSLFPTNTAKLEIYVTEGINASGSNFTMQFMQVANFEPLSTGDYNVSGTQVGSLAITNGMAAQVYSVTLSGFTITPGSYYSLQIRCSLESGSNPVTNSTSEATIDYTNAKLILG